MRRAFSATLRRMALPLDEARATALRIAAGLGVGEGGLPWFGTPGDDARPVVVEQGGAFHYVRRDRVDGERREVAATMDELLYRVFHDVTEQVAGDWARTRAEGDAVRAAAAKLERQQVLFGDLRPTWAERWEREHEAELRAAGLMG